MGLREPFGVVFPALFIGFREKDDVARQRHFVFRKQHDGLGEDRESAFEIDGAAAVDVTVLGDSSEWIYGPLVALHSHYVGMRGQQDGLLAAISAQSGDEMGLAGFGRGNDVDFKAQPLEPGGQEFRDRAFLARRVAGVDANQLGEQIGGVVRLTKRAGGGHRHEQKRAQPRESDHFVSIAFQPASS